MAIARARRDSGLNYWPGFVDALATLVLGIIFLLTVFVVVQFYLTQEVTEKTRCSPASTRKLRNSPSFCRWKDRQLQHRGTARLVALEPRHCRRRARPFQRSLRRRRHRGRRCAGQGHELSGQIEPRRGSPPARSRKWKSSINRSPRCGASFGARRGARGDGEEGQGVADAHRRSGAATERCIGSAGAGVVPLPFGFFWPTARDPRQSSRHPYRRRPLRIPVRGFFRLRQGDPRQAGRARRARQARERTARAGAERSQARSPGCCGSMGTPMCGRSTARNSGTTGSFRPGARSRSCNTWSAGAYLRSGWSPRDSASFSRSTPRSMRKPTIAIAASSSN